MSITRTKNIFHKTSKRIFRSILCISSLAFISSCDKDQIAIDDKKPLIVNSFAMEVDGHTWLPGQVGKEECTRTFNGAWSFLGGKPFFNISAYRDAQGRTNVDSEKVLQIQVMNVNETGEYKHTGSYIEDFKSFAFFKLTKEDGSHVRYSNKRDFSSFTVKFEQFIPKPNTTLKGVKGIFFGDAL